MNVSFLFVQLLTLNATALEITCIQREYKAFAGYICEWSEETGQE